MDDANTPKAELSQDVRFLNTLEGEITQLQWVEPDHDVYRQRELEAQDEVEVDYKGEELEIGFNVTYLLDALAAVDTETVEFGLTDANSSCLIRSPGTTHSRYVVMPMRL